MENRCTIIKPHPNLLEFLFTYKIKVSQIFKEVLGIHELSHMAISRLDESNQLSILSSTPSLEYNLFNSFLWSYDKTYSPLWFQQCSQDYWQSLYSIERYDELYFLKQIKHNLPIGLSLSAKVDNHYLIYSLASKKSDARTRELFATKQEDFYQMGQYCYQALTPLFDESNQLSRNIFYETSN